MSKIVVLDPGHGQYTNPYPAASGFCEGTQMWKLGQMLQTKLTNCGITVINTRPQISMDPDLTARGKTAGTNKADMFISLHSDAIGSYATDSARGVSVYYSIQDSTRNKQFAAKNSAAIAALMGTRDRGALTRVGSGGTDYYGVIRSSAASGCKCAFLVEHGFHTSPSDVKYLISDEWLNKIADAECKVICEFLGVAYDDSSTTTTTTPIVEKPVTKYTLNTEVNIYVSAADAQNSKNPKSKYSAGEYFVYREYNGMINISRTEGVAGGWINPADNIKVADSTTASTTMDDDIPTVEYSNKGIKVELSKYALKTVKNSTLFKYGQFATHIDTSGTVQISSALIQGLESLKDYLNLKTIQIKVGNVTDATFKECPCPKTHVSGYAADITCIDTNGEKVPSSVICAVAVKMGFNCTGRISEYVTHLDIRKDTSKLYFDIVNGKAKKIENIDDYFCVTQEVINTYVHGIEKKDAVVEINDGGVDTPIMGTSKFSASQLTAFVKKYNNDFDASIAEAFIKFGGMYGVRGDIALCQSCVETGYFKYAGSAVTPSQHNYCGLGVLTNGMKGNSFDTVEDGVEAQIQHLFAYASKDPIPNNRKILDPRFTYVTRGIAPLWVDLNKRWSTTNIYGQTILGVYKNLAGK